jgi:hypothetical protein
MGWRREGRAERQGRSFRGFSASLFLLACMLTWSGERGVRGVELEQQCRRDGLLDEGCVAERLDSEEALKVAAMISATYLLLYFRERTPSPTVGRGISPFQA